MSEIQFIGEFLETYLMIPASTLHGEAHSARTRIRNYRHFEQGVAGIEKFKPDLSILEKIIDHVTLYEWFTVSKDIVKFHKSKLT